MLLPETARRVDQLVTQVQATGKAPIVTAAVIRDGEPAHLSAAGHPANQVGDLQFRIGSITKTMTAAVVMQLRDEGLLSLDDLLYRHLPGTPVGSSVTLRQLLGHAAGLQREPDGKWWERMDGGDIEALLSSLTPEKLALAPHHGYHYSNLAYGLLGAVLAKLTGQEWADLITQRILTPLGMHHTSYHPTDPFAVGYVVHPWLDTVREEPRADTGAMAPAGQLWSTPNDLVKWAAFLANPDPAVLAPATVAEMCAPVVMNDLDSWTGGHGLGLELYRRGDRVLVGHGGSMPGYLANLATHRRSRTGVVVFANAYTLRGTSIQALCLDVLDAVLDCEPVPPAPWVPALDAPADVAELLGRWWWMGREYEATLDHGTAELVFDSLTRPREEMRFRAEATDRWRGVSGENDGEILQVLRDAAGRVELLDIATFLFSREPLGPEG
ncbi:CubicO group peptidase (beta-lactamase class C family) [Allocatelliglobosispora scoriae]|uniref:CubicO group peptidase (Beta-lactamase class C family) n=1 Tax=Allocatelliglobosispora scoriae TaxID=643052 RepID=A0A841BNE3_9ACTN|nr:serine hydrolase domain-containing protein [Allocatelliglobosispora scoriae]MBB5869195.1 CubicO group peptidase (beta-lactamase class C family) [Allocatelliglobosispora scoriae]